MNSNAFSSQGDSQIIFRKINDGKKAIDFLLNFDENSKKKYSNDFTIGPWKASITPKTTEKEILQNQRNKLIPKNENINFYRHRNIFRFQNLNFCYRTIFRKKVIKTKICTCLNEINALRKSQEKIKFMNKKTSLNQNNQERVEKDTKIYREKKGERNNKSYFGIFHQNFNFFSVENKEEFFNRTNRHSNINKTIGNMNWKGKLEVHKYQIAKYQNYLDFEEKVDKSECFESPKNSINHNKNLSLKNINRAYSSSPISSCVNNINLKQYIITNLESNNNKIEKNRFKGFKNMGNSIVKESQIILKKKPKLCEFMCKLKKILTPLLS